MGEKLLGYHLPLSDRFRTWLFNASGILALVLFIPMILLNVSFYWTGSLQPDPTTGRIYPMQEHGTIYVVVWQGELAMCLFWAFFVPFVLGFIVNPFRGRLFLLQDE